MNRVWKSGAAAGCLLATIVQAAEIEPRAYANTPTGVNFLLAGYVFTDGALAGSSASPIKDSQLKTHSGLLAWARSLDVAGKSAKVDVILPYTDLEGTAQVQGQTRERKVGGLSDPRMRFSVNLMGAPALSLEEFGRYQQDLIVGASLQVSAPLGQYDSSKLVNIGSNRWYAKPELGVSQAWGAFSLDVAAGVIFFSANEDYYGGKRLEQDPVYTGQIHFNYSFRNGIWASLGLAFDHGGRTRVGGVQSDDLQNNSRAGLTLALPVDRNNSVKLYASSGTTTVRGTDYDAAGIVWQHRWGGGL